MVRRWPFIVAVFVAAAVVVFLVRPSRAQTSKPGSGSVLKGGVTHDSSDRRPPSRQWEGWVEIKNEWTGGEERQLISGSCEARVTYIGAETMKVEVTYNNKYMRTEVPYYKGTMTRQETLTGQWSDTFPGTFVVTFHHRNYPRLSYLLGYPSPPSSPRPPGKGLEDTVTIIDFRGAHPPKRSESAGNCLDRFTPHRLPPGDLWNGTVEGDETHPLKGTFTRNFPLQPIGVTQTVTVSWEVHRPSPFKPGDWLAKVADRVTALFGKARVDQARRLSEEQKKAAETQLKKVLNGDPQAVGAEVKDAILSEGAGKVGSFVAGKALARIAETPIGRRLASIGRAPRSDPVRPPAPGGGAGGGPPKPTEPAVSGPTPPESGATPPSAPRPPVRGRVVENAPSTPSAPAFALTGPFRTFPMVMKKEFSGVKYYTDTERAAFRLTVKDGKLYDAHGNLFDTTNAKTLHSNESRAIFVMDAQGNIFATTQHAIGKIHHSSLSEGKPVAAAGELEVIQGSLRVITRNSGHYKPPFEGTEQALTSLATQGVDIRNVTRLDWSGKPE